MHFTKKNSELALAGIMRVPFAGCAVRGRTRRLMGGETSVKGAIREKVSSLPRVAKKAFSLMLVFSVFSLNSIPAFADSFINSKYVGVYYLDNQTGSVCNIDVTQSCVNINCYSDTERNWSVSGTNGVGRVGSGNDGFYVLFDKVQRVMSDGTLDTPIYQYIASGDVSVGGFLFSKVTITSNQSGLDYVKN